MCYFETNMKRKYKGKKSQILNKNNRDSDHGWFSSYKGSKTYKTFPFGKYKGVRFQDVPESYLQWFLSNIKDCDDNLRKAVRSALLDIKLRNSKELQDVTVTRHKSNS